MGIEESKLDGAPESGQSGDEGRLSNAEAQDEANMLLAQRDRTANKTGPQNPEQERLSRDFLVNQSHGYEKRDAVILFDPETTNEDYEEALKIVEEMRNAAENEPSALRLVARVAQVTNSKLQKFLFDLGSLTSSKSYRSNKYVLEEQEKSLHSFDDAVARLNELKSEAERVAADKDRGRGETRDRPTIVS